MYRSRLFFEKLTPNANKVVVTSHNSLGLINWALITADTHIKPVDLTSPHMNAVIPLTDRAPPRGQYNKTLLIPFLSAFYSLQSDFNPSGIFPALHTPPISPIIPNFSQKTPTGRRRP